MVDSERRRKFKTKVRRESEEPTDAQKVTGIRSSCDFVLWHMKIHLIVWRKHLEAESGCEAGVAAHQGLAWWIRYAWIPQVPYTIPGLLSIPGLSHDYHVDNDDDGVGLYNGR